MNIFISGIGGSGAYYLAKYFLFLNNQIFGSDLQNNERITDLLKNNIKINIGEPDLQFLNNLPQIDLYIYSSAIKEDHLERIYFNNKNVKSYEVGYITDLLLTQFLTKKLSDIESEALLKSELIPLLKIDFNKKKYIAITGTDGKTTTVNMIYHLIKKLNKKAGLISTLGMKINDKLIDTGLHTTTPSSQELYKLLTMKDVEDIEYVIIEVTSHALSMGRITGMKFDVVGITNITKDHLDYHKNYENYFNAKTKIFTDYLKENGMVVLNPFDNSFNNIEKICKEKNIKYKTINEDLIKKIELSKDFETNYNKINGSIAYEVVNFLFPEKVFDYKELLDFETISGRMEYIIKEPFSVIVDFAHTENGLKELLKNLRSRIKNNGNLRVVFGCAGMRDKSKRFGMGEIAEKYANYIYICPEDPRIESLPEINLEILRGMRVKIDNIEKFKESEHFFTTTPSKKEVKVFQENSVMGRYKAIYAAINEAKKNDIIVVCGKGHEKSLCFGINEYHWSDQEEIKKILSLLKIN